MRHISMFSIPKANRVKYWNCLIEFQLLASQLLNSNLRQHKLYSSILQCPDEKSDLIACTLFKNKTCRLHVCEYCESLKM